MRRTAPPPIDARMNKGLSVRPKRSGGAAPSLDPCHGGVAGTPGSADVSNMESGGPSASAAQYIPNLAQSGSIPKPKAATGSKKDVPGKQPAFEPTTVPGEVPQGYDKTLGGILGVDGEDMLVSCTVGTRGKHCPKHYFTDLFQAYSVLSEMAGVCLETGKRKGLAHCQVAGIFRVLVPFEDACIAIANAIKQWVGILRGSGGYVQVKPSEGTQTKGGLFGYIHKMPMAAKLWNVSPDELAAAKEEYELVKTDPLAGKRMLNKSNFVKEVFAYAYTNFYGNIPDIDIAALQAIRSGEYAATSVWLAGAGGSGLSLPRAKVYWRLASDPESCTLADIHTIFFYNPFQKRAEAMPIHIPSFEELKRATVEAQKSRTEHHYSAGNIVLEDDSDDDAVDLNNEPGSHHYRKDQGFRDSDEDLDDSPSPPRKVQKRGRDKSVFIDNEAFAETSNEDESGEDLD
jgi:hypothetical protein